MHMDASWCIRLKNAVMQRMAALSYWAGRYESAICCSNCPKMDNVAATYSWIVCTFLLSNL